MHSPDSPVLVGIDLAKDSFAVAIGSVPTEPVRSFALTREGLSGFLDFLAPFGAFPQAFAFGIEASGPYTKLLVAWLHRHCARVFLFNPLQIYRFRRAQSLRRTKTDAIDAHTILHYMAQVLDAVSPCQPDDDLQVLAAEYEQITQQVARLKTQIRQLVHGLFPELASSSSLFTVRILRLLLAFPSAHALAQASLAQMEQVWAAKRPAAGRASRLTATRLYELACTSIGLYAPQREVVLQSKLRQLCQLLEEQATLRTALIHAVQQVESVAWPLFLSVPGLGPVTVALFLAQSRSLERFPSHRQLAAFAGIEPTTYQSGQYTAPSHISKRGSPHLRRTLYLMAQSVIRHSLTFRTYFDQLVARGKAYRVAVIASANKLLRVLFALYRSLTLFRDRSALEVSHS
jgi:transposase